MPLTPPAAATVPLTGTVGKRRRENPSLTEQVRRQAWGREWGQILSDAAKRLRSERA